jgi:hypothetical protein
MIPIAISRIVTAGACAAVFAVDAFAAGEARLVQSLDENWRFQPGITSEAVAPGYDDSAWRVVQNRPFAAEDIRFTQKDGKTLYAVVLELPKDGQVTVKSLALKIRS